MFDTLSINSSHFLLLCRHYANFTLLIMGVGFSTGWREAATTPFPVQCSLCAPTHSAFHKCSLNKPGKKRSVCSLPRAARTL